MSRIVYEGDAWGDRNDLIEYRIYCSCNAPLGRVGLLQKQNDGFRKVVCENCGFATAIDGSCKIALHGPVPPETLDALGITPKRVPLKGISTVQLDRISKDLP